MELRQEQFKELIDEASDAGRATVELHAELFTQLVGDTTPAPSTGEERRASARIGVLYAVTVRPIASSPGADTTPFRALLRDLSSDGIGLTCPVPLHARFALELPDKDGVVHSVPCGARSCRRLAEGYYQVGGTFSAAALHTEAA